MNLFRVAAGIASVLTVSLIYARQGSEAAQPPAKSESGLPEILFVRAPVVTAGEFGTRFPRGSGIVRMSKRVSPDSITTLTPELFAATDPQVSFDGAQVLFAGQKEPGARWQIWEMAADGSSKRQLTDLAGDCLRPAFLPRDEIVFTVVTYDGPRATSQVYVAKGDGSGAHPITFGPGNFKVETVLHNGRILVSAASPLRPGPEVSRELFTLRPDGTGLKSLRCDHRRPAIRAQAEELENGAVVFVKYAGAELGGELAQIRRGALSNSTMILPNPVWSPRRLDGEKLIVARSNSSTRGTSGKFDLYSFDSARGQFGELVYSDPKLSSLQAVPLGPRPVPRWYWSTLNPQTPGYFVCLDSRLSREAPDGRLPGRIASVRVKTLEPGTNQEQTLGLAPVEEDGSFYIAVPPDRPVRFELVDSHGATVRAQRSWIWARAGEEHGCVGCHEDKAVAPDNRWPLALKRFDMPAQLGIKGGLVAAH